MDTTTANVTVLLLLIAGVGSLMITLFIRRRKTSFPVRALAAFDAIPVIVGEGIEAGRPVHVSFGSAGLGGALTPLTLASAAILREVTRRAASGAVAPLVTTSEASALPLAYGTLQRAYAARDRLDRYRATSVRWLPAGARSLAFAASLTVMKSNEKVSGTALVGSFGTELALILESTRRRGQTSLAGSDQLDGVAVAYAMADHPLIGEEVFAGAAYLDDTRAHPRAGLIVTDLLRWLVILGIAIAAANAVREPVGAALSGLFGGGG